MLDSKRICVTPGCSNLGQYKGKTKKGGVVRRPKCYGCRFLRTGKKKGRKSQQWRVFREQHTDKCEYCDWVGPCDIHRPQPQEPYSKDNMRAACPNCHRLITKGVMVDRFL